ncbi:MAG: CHAP domain-containing protein, partial [Clostridia bacterium]|nr:CHAP domain-containing protein [Clostridia bacterium]
IKTIKETKEIIKTAMVSIKTITTGTKALIVAMLAGGWAIGVIILVICIIAMLISGIANGQASGLVDYNDERTLKYAIYGTNGSNDIVQVALSQVGNVGGEPYWSWYGFSSRVEWCACFVSFCANECGYIESGVIPKFASCENEGVKWFKEHNLWQERNYIPKAGNIIFFDWKEKHDGLSDHVGIVEKVENGRVYTIEGNSNDSCKQRDYDINSEEIQGYGTPIY